MTSNQSRIISLLKRFYYLTTSQFYSLCGFPPKLDLSNSPQRSFRATLKRGAFAIKGLRPKLWNKDIVFRGVNKTGRPVIENVFWLDGEKRPYSLSHEVVISDVHIALGDIWWKQTDLKHGGINPDAFFYKEPYYYFLEVELQPNSFSKHSGIAKKLERYVEYRTNGDYPHHPNMQDFFVLVVVETEERLANLTQELKRRGMDYGMFKIRTRHSIAQSDFLL